MVYFFKKRKEGQERKAEKVDLILLSRFDKNLPKILIARTRKPLVASMPIIVWTHSYRMAFPAFLFESVFVATWININTMVNYPLQYANKWSCR